MEQDKHNIFGFWKSLINKISSNMNKTILVILVLPILALTLFTSPSQTDAAWWNPLSWFERGEQVTDTKTLEELKVEVNELKTLVKFMQEELGIYHKANLELLKRYDELDKKTQAVAEATKITAEAGIELEKKVDSLWSWRWLNFSY
jgi:hypothetical protein